eukprot:1303662-Amphidinium_carterae.1
MVCENSDGGSNFSVVQFRSTAKFAPQALQQRQRRARGLACERTGCEGAGRRRLTLPAHVRSQELSKKSHPSTEIEAPERTK